MNRAVGYASLMSIDSFKYLPRSFRAGYEVVSNPPTEPVWAPLERPVEEATVALLTSAGLYLAGRQEPFDLDRERAEPMWGDPTYRIIPRDTPQEAIAASHLHINTRDFYEDYNVALPIAAFEDLVAEGAIGSVAEEHYSVMGYQAPGCEEWQTDYGPDLARRLQEAQVDAVILAPA